MFLFVLIALTAFWYFLVKPLTYWKTLGVYQSKSPWVLFGDSWRRMNIFNGQDANPKYSQWLMENSKKNGYIGVYDMYIPSLCVTDPDLLKTISVKEFEYFCDRDPEALGEGLDSLWGRNLLCLRGQEWKNVRSLLTPVYTSSKLKLVFNSIVEKVEHFVHVLNSVTENKTITELDIYDFFGRFTNDVIASTAFGVNVDSLLDRDNDFYKSAFNVINFRTAKRVVHLLILRVLPSKISKLFNLEILDRKDGALFIEVIEERIKQEQQGSTNRTDMLHLVVEAVREGKNNNWSTPVTSTEIMANTFLFLFGGLDSLSTALSFAAYELALNHDVQAKLRKEIVETSQKYEQLTVDVLKEMRYMDMVISEVLRKWPSFVFTDRLVVKPYTLQTTNKVPIKLNSGNRIIIPIYGIHRNPDYYPNPEKFDPERFSEENRANLNPYVYMPFGVGHRLCLGYRFALLEIKAMLYHMLMNFELLPTDKTPKVPKIQSGPFQYQLENGFWVGVRSIQKQK